MKSQARSIDRAAAGDSAVEPDADSFAARFQAAYGRLVVIAAAVAGDAGAAEDVVQEAALIAVRKQGEFTHGTNFAAWMAEIVRNCALNWRRKRSRRRTRPTDPAELQAVPATPPPEGASAADGHSWKPCFDDEVWQALLSLSEAARTCLLLRTINDLSYGEIAQLTGLPEGTAMSHVHRGKASLRRALSNRAAEATEGRANLQR